MANRLLIEHLHDIALEKCGPELSLATDSKIIYDAGIPDDHNIRDMRLDHESVASFLEKFGAPAHTLGRMALYLYDGEAQSDNGIAVSKKNFGSIKSDMVYTDSGLIHYPLICLNISKHRTIADLNNTSKHELRHAADGCGASLYQRLGVVNTLRASLGLLSLYNANSAVDSIMENGGIDVSSSVLALSSMLVAWQACRVRQVLYVLSKKEARAYGAEKEDVRLLYMADNSSF